MLSLSFRLNICVNCLFLTREHSVYQVVNRHTQHFESRTDMYSIKNSPQKDLEM